MNDVIVKPANSCSTKPCNRIPVTSILIDRNIERVYRAVTGFRLPAPLAQNVRNFGTFGLSPTKVQDYILLETQAPAIDVTRSGSKFTVNNGRHRLVVALIRQRPDILARIHHPYQDVPLYLAPAKRRALTASDAAGKRIGEAAHPGPSHTPCRHGSGCTNPHHAHRKGEFEGWKRRKREGKSGIGGNAQRGTPNRKPDLEVCPAHGKACDCPLGESHFHLRRQRSRSISDEIDDEVPDSEMEMYTSLYNRGPPAVTKQEQKQARAASIGNRSNRKDAVVDQALSDAEEEEKGAADAEEESKADHDEEPEDRKSTRLNSSHR